MFGLDPTKMDSPGDQIHRLLAHELFAYFISTHEKVGPLLSSDLLALENAIQADQREVGSDPDPRSRLLIRNGRRSGSSPALSSRAPASAASPHGDPEGDAGRSIDEPGRNAVSGGLRITEANRWLGRGVG